VDNKNGTYESTKHLINQGHEKILYLSGPLKNDISKERLNGYIRALEKNNIPATVRISMGSDISGACGQLRRKHK